MRSEGEEKNCKISILTFGQSEADRSEIPCPQAFEKLGAAKNFKAAEKIDAEVDFEAVKRSTVAADKIEGEEKLPNQANSSGAKADRSEGIRESKTWADVEKGTPHARLEGVHPSFGCAGPGGIRKVGRGVGR